MSIVEPEISRILSLRLLLSLSACLRFNVRTNAVSGSYTAGFGYACELPALVRHWRELWAQTPNTTAPLAPFGIVGLHPRAGWHGARDMGGFRHLPFLYQLILCSLCSRCLVCLLDAL